MNKKPSIAPLIVLAIILVAIGGYNAASVFSQAQPSRDSNDGGTVQEPEIPTIEITYITAPECADCTDLTPFVEALQQNKVNIANLQTVKGRDTEAADLIETYGLTKLPALIITGEYEQNQELLAQLARVGNEKDGAYIITRYAPPYLDLSTNEVRGRVELTLLFDRSCKDCYDVSVNEKILKNYGVKDGEAALFEISSDEGRELISRYNITQVPTFIITGEYREYSQLMSIWPQIGTDENDALIFRNGVAQMGTYKNLETGEVITKATQSATTFANLNPDEFSTMLTEENDAILLDVRTPREYEESHIEGAVLIPVDELAQRLDELNPDKKIMVYCRSGNRSARASQILVDNGFENVYNLEKGILEWEAQGLPTIKE